MCTHQPTSLRDDTTARLVTGRVKHDVEADPPLIPTATRPPYLPPKRSAPPPHCETQRERPQPPPKPTAFGNLRTFTTQAASKILKASVGSTSLKLKPRVAIHGKSQWIVRLKHMFESDDGPPSRGPLSFYLTRPPGMNIVFHPTGGWTPPIWLQPRRRQGAALGSLRALRTMSSLPRTLRTRQRSILAHCCLVHRNSRRTPRLSEYPSFNRKVFAVVSAGRFGGAQRPPGEANEVRQHAPLGALLFVVFRAMHRIHRDRLL